MKQEKQRQKSQNGITLIALSVTIIIILILAGISITALLGNNGLIDKAKLANEKTEEAIQNDIDAIDEYNQELDELIKEMENKKTLLAMYNAGLSCSNPENCTDENHLHIGDYVNYVEPTSGGYTVYAAKSGMGYDQHYTLSTDPNNKVNDLNWRVLGKDKETGGIKLIADSPMRLGVLVGETDERLFFDGAEGYEYGPTEMDNVCAMYKNSLAVKARSVNIEDIDEITGKTTDVLREEVNSNTYSWGWEPLGTNYRFEGQYTPAKWIEIGKQADSSKTITVSGTANGYAYIIAKTEEEKTTLEGEGYKPVLLENTKVYDMLFKNIDRLSYWLASTSVLTDLNSAAFGAGAVYSYDDLTIVDSCTRQLFF